MIYENIKVVVVVVVAVVVVVVGGPQGSPIGPYKMDTS